MSSLQQLEARIRRLEDREEIGELIARYGLVMDNRDMEALPALFAPGAVVRSLDGVMNAKGHEAITELFRGRFKVLGPSNHFTHDRILTFDEGDPDRASGLVLSHAEMNRLGQAMITAIRYHDEYRRHEGRWRFRERVLTFFYYVPASQYLDALGDGLAQRMRAYNDAAPADWPEGLETWRSYYGA
jgi:ketosteroid isomerase-like protein